MPLPVSERVLNLPLSLIDESPFNPRRLYREDTLQEMATTIKSVNVVQPIIVRRSPADKDRYQVVFGSRRRRATQIAGKDTIPAIVRNLTDEQILCIQFIENEQREDLPPLAQGRAYAALMEHNPTVFTVEEISARLGKRDGRYVAERLQLLHLIPAAQSLLENERLPFRHAFELSRLTPAQQERALYVCFSNFESAEVVIARPHQTVSISLDALRSWITTHCHLDLQQAPFPLNEAIAGEGPCDQCPKRGGVALLFSDIATEATCLDPECFQKKRNALVQIQAAHLADGGAKVVRVSQHLRVGGSGENPETLYRGEYRVVGRDSCAFTEVGIAEEANQPPVYICREETCPVHAGKTRYSTPKQKEAQKKKVRDQRQEKQFRTDLLAAIRDKVSKTPQKPDHYLVACRFLEMMPHEQRISVFRLFKWLQQKSAGKRGGKHVNYVELGKTQLGKLGLFELQRFLIVASLAGDLSISDEAETLPPNSQLAVAAKRMKLDLKSIRAKSRKAAEPTKQKASAA